MTNIERELTELRDSFVFDESYLLGFSLEPGRLVLHCELLSATREADILSPDCVAGNVTISGVEVLKFDQQGQIAASGGAELDLGLLILEACPAGIVVSTSVGQIFVGGAELSCQMSS